MIREQVIELLAQFVKENNFTILDLITITELIHREIMARYNIQQQKNK